MSEFIGQGSKRWTAQTLIRNEDLIDIIQQNVCIREHPIPENTYGNLFCVDGIVATAAAIMDYLESRAIEQKRRNKDVSE